MKKIISGLILFVFLAYPLASLAVVEPRVPADEDLTVIMDRIIQWTLGFLLAFAVLMIIVAGYYFVTAQGDPDKVATARKFVLWALIGVLVGVVSWALVNFVLVKIIA